jgi:presequence protease
MEKKMYGFTVIDIEEQQEYRGKGIRLRHDRTGMDVYHLHCEDRENLFAFAFKTPPSDDTGLPHILEHSVLSGSRRFPVKDPFLALMRGSMNTFLNAMTYPDKTVYPAASPVEQDYFNLMSVYADSVFFPSLSEEVFRQEGHRLEKNDEGDYAITGIVFNEMKGAYSNHDSIVGEWSYRTLFPDTPYRHDSGGDPRFIARLSFEQFREFHKRFYHPSNCRLFLYGDISTERQLQFLQEHYLEDFGEREARPDNETPDQPKWEAPRRFSFTSPADGEGKEADHKSSIVLSWLVGALADPDDLLSLEVLSEILLGHVGSPLYKQIIDSGLGEDLSPVCGLETDLKELAFAVGIRGSDPSRAEAFETLIEKTLSRFVSHGLPAEAVEGALKRVEFRERELKGGIPFGLRLMGKALRGWLHGQAPGQTLAFTAPMERLKKRAEEDPRFFEKMIEQRFLNNPHRATVTVTPHGDHDLLIEKELEAYSSKVMETLGEEGLAELEEKNRRLRFFQDTPDSPEAIASIPTLSIKDVLAEVVHIDTRETELDGIRCFLHDFYTNGILYTDLVFDIEGLSRQEMLYLPLFTRMLLHTSLPESSYDQVAHRLFRDTGGFYSFLESSPVLGTEDTRRSYLGFRLKCLEESSPEALDLAFSILSRAVLSDTRRLKEVLSEMRNDNVSGVIPSGNSLATVRACAHLSPSLIHDELWRGTEQLLFLDALNSGGEEVLAGAAEQLEQIRIKLFGRKRLLCNLTADGSYLAKAQAELSERLARFPEGTSPGREVELSLSEGKIRAESLIVPSAVNFVAAVLPGARIDSPLHAHQMLLSQLLKTTFLWERIRMRGGAYGAGCFSNGLEGIFGFSSYRDPHIVSTVEAFRESLQLIAEMAPDQGELEKAVISIVGKETRPQSPGEKSMVGFRRVLYGVTDEMRSRKRRELIGTLGSDVSGAAESLLSGFSRAAVVVLGSETSVGKAAAKMPDLGVLRTRLPQ